MSIMPVPGNQAQNIQQDSSLQQSQQSIQANIAETKENLSEMMSFMKTTVNSSAEIIDNEVTMLTKNQLGQKEKAGTEANAAALKEVPNKNQDEVVAQMSAIMTEDEIKRRKKAEEKKKESKFDQKMETLSKLEGKINVEQLDNEEKGIVQKFFENMKSIRNLKRKLKQLEEEEKFLESQLKKTDKEKLHERHKEILNEISDKKGL